MWSCNFPVGWLRNPANTFPKSDAHWEEPDLFAPAFASAIDFEDGCLEQKWLRAFGALVFLNYDCSKGMPLRCSGPKQLYEVLETWNMQNPSFWSAPPSKIRL